jgi:hypothetical protein
MLDSFCKDSRLEMRSHFSTAHTAVWAVDFGLKVGFLIDKKAKSCYFKLLKGNLTKSSGGLDYGW